MLWNQKYLPDSAIHVLGLKTCTTMPGYMGSFTNWYLVTFDLLHIWFFCIYFFLSLTPLKSFHVFNFTEKFSEFLCVVCGLHSKLIFFPLNSSHMLIPNFSPWNSSLSYTCKLHIWCFQCFLSLSLLCVLLNSIILIVLSTS